MMSIPMVLTFSEGRQIESQQSEVLNLWAENKPDQHSVDRPPSYLMSIPGEFEYF